MKRWCGAKWPIMISNPEGITLNFSQKNYRRWSESGDRNSDVNHINQVWVDIEVRNFLIEFLFTHLCEDADNNDDIKLNLYINSLRILSFDMYVDLDIIRTILNKNFGHDLVAIEHAELFNKIRDIRSHMKIHRDKPDFYLEKNSVWSTYKHGTDFQLQIEKKDGGIELISLEPQKDAKLMADILDIIFNI